MNNDDLLRLARTDQVRRGMLPSSVKKRTLCLRAFTRWLDGKCLLTVQREDVEKFLDQRELTPGSRYGWVSHIHCFYVWAINEELTDHDPTARIIRPKLRRHLPRPAPTDQLADALKYGSPRLRAWIVLAAYQGLRVQEIAGLEREDIVEGEGLLRVVHGKGAKERLLPLHPEVFGALQGLPMPRTGRIFSRPRGGAYSPQDLSLAFNRDLKDAGVEATAHQLRHWFATNLYSATHDLRLTQEMMGHSSPQTTAVYTAFDARAAVAGVGQLNLGGAA
jgi:integrase/recombinase XerC